MERAPAGTPVLVPLLGGIKGYIMYTFDTIGHKSDSCWVAVPYPEDIYGKRVYDNADRFHDEEADAIVAMAHEEFGEHINCLDANFDDLEHYDTALAMENRVIARRYADA